MSYVPHFATCRVCKAHTVSRDLIKYGIRHYAHADCAMTKWGAAFFQRLTPWQATRFPYFAAKRQGADALAALEKRASEYRP